MSKFNTRTAARSAVASPITSTSSTSDATTYQGGAGYTRDERSELFLLAVTNFVGEKTFYESAHDRDDRFGQLVRSVAVNDGPWFASFVRWLRSEGNMRSAALVAAAEGVKARLDAETTDAVTNRQIVASVLQRADEPGELVSYWKTHFGAGSKPQLPQSVKRGIADAIEGINSPKSLYTLYSAFKYDTDSKGVRFADVVELVHPAANDAIRSEFYRWLLDRRHSRDNGEYPHLTMVHARERLMKLTDAEKLAFLSQSGELRDAEMHKAGVTWEWLASWYGKELDARFWEAMIPNMGYMALLRNLRNFDQVGVSDVVANSVTAKLADPAEVARSRQLPMRFLSAYRAVPSLRWGYALEKALNLSLGNIPVLGGNTLILVDTSDSMNAGFSQDGMLMRWDAATLFGVALGQRCEQATVVSFSNSYWNTAPSMVFPMIQGESLLKSLERWRAGGYFIDGGTDTPGAIRRHLRADHTRVVILTDEQTEGSVSNTVPATTPLYTHNLAGYRYGHAPSGNAYRHTFGGLVDQMFSMIPLLERGRDGQWPWDVAN